MSTIDSRPYRWPYHGWLDPARTALLLCTGDGAPQGNPSPGPSPMRGGEQPLGQCERPGRGSAGISTVPEALVRLWTTCRQVGIATVLLPRAGVDACLPPALAAPDLVVTRPRLGGFCGTDLDLVLRTRGLTDLLITGLPMELGADCTMREANDLGYECLLVPDACTALDPETFAGATGSALMSGGIFGAVAPAEAVLHALEREGSSRKGAKTARV